jgi:hypothetical protein|tara:strand:+ start:83 stop:223 length:141 start_codon:yes stop_codon:yes gene_type:complete
MTEFEFITLCNENLIYPTIALENENIIQALKSRNDELVKKLIQEEF